MSTADPQTTLSPTRTPAVVFVALGAVGLALLGGLYLIVVRGESLLVDLAGMARTMLCL
jgi:hypothetical protein